MATARRIAQSRICASTAKDNIDLTEDTSEPATSTISIRADAAAALKDWWAARVELYHATSPPTEERISDTVEILNNARDGVRLAREQSEVTASSMQEFREKIAVCSSRSNPDHLALCTSEVRIAFRLRKRWRPLAVD